jgi:hypothetical protein
MRPLRRGEKDMVPVSGGKGTTSQVTGLEVVYEVEIALGVRTATRDGLLQVGSSWPVWWRRRSRNPNTILSDGSLRQTRRI